MAEPPAVAPTVSRLSALAPLGDRLVAARSLDEVFHAIHQELGPALDVTVLLLGLYDGVSQTVEVVRQVDRDRELPGGSFPLGQGFTSRAIRERRAILIRDWSHDGPPIQVLYGTERDRLVRPDSGMTVPLIAAGRVVGVLSVQAYRKDAYDEEDLLLFRAVGAMAATAVDRIRRQGVLDPQVVRRISELEAILASMTDALLIVDATGALTRINHAARELLAIGPGSIVMGQPLLAGQPPDRWPFGAAEAADALTAMFDRLREGESVREVEVELRTPLRVLSFSGAPLRDADGSFAGAVIVFRDVTSRREIERLKDEMLSTASHDLRTPITAIKGQAQLLARRRSRGALLEEDLGKGIELIVRQSDRMADLIDVLLDLSRIQVGRLQVDLAPMDLSQAVGSVVEAVRSTTERHEIAVRLPARVEGTWDGRRLRQVLENLLANAVRYSPDGGRIDIDVEDRGREVTVRVRDLGIGLTPDEARRAFEREYRGDRARQLRSGEGLGLFISRAIVLAHGGRIWARSEGPDRGTTFAFTLPRKSGGTPG